MGQRSFGADTPKRGPRMALRNCARIALIAVLSTAMYANANTSRPVVLANLIKAGLTPEALSPYSITGPEFAMILADAADSQGQFELLHESSAMYAARLRDERLAASLCSVNPGDNGAVAALAAAQEALANARTSLDSVRAQFYTDLVGPRVTAQELTTLLATLTSQSSDRGSALVPWDRLSASQRVELASSVSHLRGGVFNPTDPNAVATIRAELVQFGGSAYSEFDERISRWQVLSSSAGQWLAGG